MTLLLVYSACLGFPRIFTPTVSQTLFLEKFSAQSLPYVFIASSVLSSLVGIIYLKLQERFSFSKLLLTISIFIIVSQASLYSILTVFDARWPAFLIAIWFEVEFVFLGLLFWGLAGRLLNVRQGKRLFGFIAMGEIFSSIFCGLSVQILVRYIGTLNLLFCSALGIVLSIGILIYTARIYPEKFTQKEVKEKRGPQEKTDEQFKISNLLKNRYVLLLFTIYIGAYMTVNFIDVAFYDRAKFTFPNSEELAGFLGMFLAASSITSLVLGSLLSGRLISRFGLLFGLLALPIGTGLGAAGVAGFGTAWGPDIMAVFWWMTLTKLLFKSLIKTIHNPAIAIAYQPLEPSLRTRVQGLSESILVPIVNGVSGIILLFLDQFLGFRVVELCYTMLVVISVWIFSTFLTRREYTVRLTSALAKRTFTQGVLSFDDSSSVAILQKALTSPHPEEVTYALSMLEESHHKSMDKFLIQLLEHADSKVREDVLRRVERLGRTTSLEAVKKRVQVEPLPQVRGSALRTFAALGEAEVLDEIMPYLNHNNSYVKSGAMVGLLRSGGIQGVLLAGSELLKKVSSEKTEDRVLAAQVLGEVGIRDFYQPLLELINDEVLQVRREALIAAGKLKNSKLWPLVVDRLSRRQERTVAASALISGGEDALDHLEIAFDEHQKRTDIRVHIARICGQIRGEGAIRLLLKQIDISEEEVRHHILVSLKLCRYKADENEVAMMETLILSEIEDAAWEIAALADVARDNFGELLTQALQRGLFRNQERVFLLLSFIYDARNILQAWANINNKNREKRAYALELIDNLLPQELKQLVFPLIEELTLDQRMKRLHHKFPQHLLGRNGRLKEIVVRSPRWTSAWTKGCAIYTAGRLGAMEFYDEIIASLSSPSVLIRETSVWALGRLNPDDLIKHLSPLTNDPSPQVAEMARFVIGTVGMAGVSIRSSYLKKLSRHDIELFANMLYSDGESRTRRCRAAHILGLSRSAAARSILLEALDIRDETVRTAVLHELNDSHFTIDDSAHARLYQLILDEFHDIENTVSILKFLIHHQENDLLLNALHQELDRNRERVLLILGLVNESNFFQTMNYWYVRREQTHVPSEINKTLSKAMRRFLQEEQQEIGDKLLLVLQIQSIEMLAQSWDWELTVTNDLSKALAELAFGSSSWIRSWTRVCALRTIVDFQLKELAQQIVETLSDPDEFVRETSIWALYQLDQASYLKYSLTLQNDPSPQVASLIKQLTEEIKNEAND